MKTTSKKLTFNGCWSFLLLILCLWSPTNITAILTQHLSPKDLDLLRMHAPRLSSAWAGMDAHFPEELQARLENGSREWPIGLIAAVPEWKKL